MRSPKGKWTAGPLAALFVAVLAYGIWPAEQKPAWLCEFAASAREVLARPFFTLGDFHVTTGFLLKADLFLGF